MTDAAPAPMLPLRWLGPPPGGPTGNRAGHSSGDRPAGRGRTGTRRTGDVGHVGDQDGAGDLRRLEGARGPGAPGGAGEGTGTQAPPEVVVRTSTRRRKTATAFWEDARIVVVLPAHVRKADRQELVEWLVGRVLAKRPRAAASDAALAARAASLADRFVDGVRPTSIRWVTNQGKRWGSCSTQTGEIRLSHRLRVVPEWVLDATIVHELAHLVHADHSPRFHAIADRYPRQKEARVFLEGYSLGLRTSDA